MSSSTRPIDRLLATGWCVLVPSGVLAVYLGLGSIVVMLTGDSIVGTAAMGAVVILVVGAVRLRRPRWLTHSPEPAALQKQQRVPFMSMALACGLLAFVAGQSLALWLYTTTGSPGFEQTSQIQAASGTTATLVLTLIVAPVAEEMLFRGLLYPLLRKRVGVITSVIISGTVFALMHANVVQFAAALPLAVLLALIYERTRKLWPCIALHLAFNLAATLVPAQVLSAVANPVSVVITSAAFAGYLWVLCQVEGGITNKSVEQ